MKRELFDIRSDEFHTLNSTSAILALVVVVLVLAFKLFRPKPLDRVSINLQAAGALIDALRHICLLYTTTDNKTACSFIAFMGFFAPHASLYFNMGIAANLHLLYIKECTPKRHWKKWLYYAPVCFSLIIDLIPLATGSYGKAPQGTCNIMGNYGNLFNITNSYITCIPGYAYCLFVFFHVVIKILRTKPEEAYSGEDKQPLAKHAQSVKFRELALRISLYSLSFVLCHLGGLAVKTYSLFKDGPTPNFLHVWCFLGLGLKGTLNLVCFLLDPAFNTAINCPSSQNHEEGSVVSSKNFDHQCQNTAQSRSGREETLNSTPYNLRYLDCYYEAEVRYAYGRNW